ncbi:MAG: PHP domain-containing protein [Clostridia bacterium]|nr:PHP domain-containing protein [Clostridia bacterium]
MITSDYHIHTEYSCDDACMTYNTLIKKAKIRGIKDFGVTDHIHTPFNHPDIKNSHEMFMKKKIEGMHFGVEVSAVSKWELDKIALGDYEGNITYGIREGGIPEGELAIAIDEAFIKKYDIEFVVGGTHWLMYKEYTRENLIHDYHRQNLFLANHPLIDIVAHPWWYMGPFKNERNLYTTLPWFDDFKVIPQSIHVELAEALIKNGKFHEVNLSAILLSNHYTEHFKKQYLEYLAFMQDLGVKFTVGSDCHNENYDIDFIHSNSLIEKYGIKIENNLFSALKKVTGR